MIKAIQVKNFRSIESASVALAPLTVLYGPTASGKSSLLYSLLVLRNFVVNPNRQADGYFHLGFIDLGGFDQCAYNHDLRSDIEIGLAHDAANESGSYSLAFSKTSGTIELGSMKHKMTAKIAIPYGANQSFAHSIKEGETEYTVNWNGITCTVAPTQPTVESQQRAQELAILFNQSSEVLRGIDIIPHRRGFFKPSYTPVPVSPMPTTEDEVASIIINDPNMAARISVYAEEIFGRDFRLYAPPGTATEYFQTTDKKSKIPGLLVNDGFGVNQVIYLLAKVNRTDVQTVLLEEPEVHLHPTVLRNLARTLANFVKQEGKQIILATHSELFLSSLLSVVIEGTIHPEDIKCYLATKEKKSTTFKEQKVNKDGQVEGGLTSFVEAELEDLRNLLGVK